MATTDTPITSDDVATTIPGLGEDRAVRTITILQERLACLLDVHLTLKHIDWNVGPRSRVPQSVSFDR